MAGLPSLRDPPRELAPEDPTTRLLEASEAWPALPRGFHERPSDDLARALLGCMLLSEDADGLTGGLIVETEAYGGPEDRASHARAGLTRRTAPMFGPAGHAYVYLIYGLHSCLNVVAESDERAGAVLVRAIEPQIGLELMRARRGAVAARGLDVRLAAGPARLTQAMGITRELDGHDLTTGTRLWISSGREAGATMDGQETLVGPRIGVGYADGGWAERPWRFGVRGSLSLSRPFPPGDAQPGPG
jgi:DNA-3-methyladenine glycosylase